MAAFLYQFLLGGAGSGEWTLSFLVPGTVRLLGVLQVVGLALMSVFFVLLGIGFFARGVVGPAEVDEGHRRPTGHSE